MSHLSICDSLNHIEFGVIKSGIQKSIRRCDEKASIAYAIEGDLFYLAEKEGRAKPNRTNLMNRLRICLVEDMFDWQTILITEPWFTQWEHQRQNESSRKYC